MLGYYGMRGGLVVLKLAKVQGVGVGLGSIGFRI